ncbi:FRG domain-containing protein [Telluribacter sp. SYSU D00476]|uniref:FRG domain-containing protein n=1 Tax=Telluribacter sp. SYSU D00476 TaxID=2811430 RepID=UPI001FF3B7D1|nr:FRG domain-containing protein [Telluribacter sp. SYSU D00476]
MSYYKEIKLESWAEYKELAERSRLEWIFRGQANSAWDLTTTLERSDILINYPEFEDKHLLEFQKGAKFYLENEKLPTTLLEWFSMLQHFGAPSRLLDFTKSPYIAAYFAFEQANSDTEEIAIWIVNKIFLAQKAAYYLESKIGYPYYEDNYAYNDIVFERVYDKSKEGDLNCIIPVEPSNLNHRYFLQQSIFLCQCNPHEKLVSQFDFLGNIKHQTIMKVTIPASQKKIAIRDMIKMNITRATIFPGLDGFAKSLVIKYSNLSNFGDTGDTLKYAQERGLT